MGIPLLNGIYECLVVDNSNFYINGTIGLSVSGLQLFPASTDLSKDYSQGNYENNILPNMLNAYVYTPIGGGKNFGIMRRPQINQRGVVQFMEGNIRKPIYMGAIFEAEKEEGSVTRLLMPSDDPDAIGEYKDAVVKNDDGKMEKQLILEDDEELIIRLKSTSKPTDKGDPIDWDKSNTDNLIVIGKGKFLLRHFSKWDKKGDDAFISKYEEISLSDGVIEAKVFSNPNDDEEKTITSSITIGLDEVKTTIENKEERRTSSITQTNSEIKLNALDDNTSEKSNIEMTFNKIDLFCQSARVQIEKNSEGRSEVTLGADVLRLGGSEIHLGTGRGYLVTCAVPGVSVPTEQGYVLNVSQSVVGG